jgi:hypothetical protein
MKQTQRFVHQQPQAQRQHQLQHQNGSFKNQQQPNEEKRKQQQQQHPHQQQQHQQNHHQKLQQKVDSQNNNGSNKKPKSEIFDNGIVLEYMQWKATSKAGPGLNNLGNTCFLNSVLQCLVHTPALTQVLLKESKLSLHGLDRPGNQQKAMLQLYQRYIVKRKPD